MVEGGTTLGEAVEVARLADATGAVDYINTTVGVATATLYMVVASVRTGPGYAMHVPAIRAAVGIPVIGAGRITSPREAEQVLAAGQCDLVGVVRGQIADPDFTTKARQGNEAAIRTCLSCNQECAGRVGRNRWLGCTGNPRAGREAVPLPPPVTPASRGTGTGRRVYVVGGGPGGLQAAVTAAEHVRLETGHPVDAAFLRAEQPDSVVLAT